MITVSRAMLEYLNNPTPENKAKLKPSDLVARDTFTGETMKLEEVRPESSETESGDERNGPSSEDRP
jgi:hypothetical protein